jgi:hypothetical protein
MRARHAAFALLAVAAAACEALFSLDGFDSQGASGGGGSVGGKDAGSEADASDASHAEDAPKDAPPDCNNGEDPCGPGFDAGAGFCGGSTQITNNKGLVGCLYTCKAGLKPCIKWCPGGCVIEEAGIDDHCTGEAPATCP